MRTKQKNVLYDLFYKEFKMIDKMNYIKKVMDSCQTNKQLDSTLNWGKRVIWQNYDMMDKKLDKYDSCFSIPISNKLIAMTGSIERELIKYHLKKSVV